ncbi:unnamed protein product [Durusdinium trenchii]|uniref:EF-hand domain-containing protein n=1 Tax=Durusdinium trenchii TaxID=1381693 RepID=A0ABP0NYX7_9DINO
MTQVTAPTPHAPTRFHPCRPVMALSQEEKHERASRSLEELEEVIETFRKRSQEFQELKKVREKPGMAASEVKRLESGVEDFQETFKQFGLDVKDYISKHAPHFAALGLSLDLRRSWLDAVNKSGEQRKEAGEALEAVRAACRNAKETAKKELLRAAKVRLHLEEDPGEMAVSKARELVEMCEDKVEPFIGIPQNKDENEMDWIAKELEPMIAEAEEGIQAAFTQTQEHPLKMEVEIEEEIREEINEYLKDEAKRLQMALGQFGRRTGRVKNLVANYQRDVQKAKSKELLDELKPQILEAVKALNVEEASAEVSEAIKEAEVLSEKVRSMALMPAEELQAIAKEMDAKVAEAASSLEAFQDQLCPIEEHTVEEVDDYVKQVLRKHIFSEMKGFQAKLDFFQVRLKRLRGILERCAQQIKSQDVFRLKKVRTKVLAMMDVFREDQADKGLEGLPSKDVFRMLDKDEDGVLNREEFLGFFEDVFPLLQDKYQQLQPSTEELESLFEFGLKNDETSLSFDGFERLLIRFMQVVQTTTMTKNVAITAGEVIRSLKPGELLEVLGGPQTNSAQLRRVFCRAKDGAIGWVTVTSNAARSAKRPTRNTAPSLGVTGADGWSWMVGVR